MFFRVNKLILITILIFSISCSNKKVESFSFVQLCDTQLGMGGYEHDVKSFKLAVTQINELNPDFVVICGDLVGHLSDTTVTDFLKIKNGFEIPCYLVAGNHDVGNIPNDTTLTYYREKLGKDYYEFTNKGCSFIVTNSLLWKNNIENESDKHDKWFKETLHHRTTKNQTVFVIGHFPLYIKSIDEEETYFNISLGKRMELLTLFAQNNVKAYLSGHKHEVIINNYENVQLVTGETTSKNFDKRPLGFRHWKVTSDSVKHHFVALRDSTLNNVND